LATVFGLGLLALLGLPPFSLFASELGIARAGAAGGLGWAVAIAFGLVLVIFAALARHGAGMLLGAPAAADEPLPPVGGAALAPLAGGLVACAALGVTLGPLKALLAAAA